MIEAKFILMLMLLLALLAFSAFFSGSETALMAINRLRLKHLAKTMPKRVKLVEHLLKKPERLIGTILLGNNLVNVAMSAIATLMAVSLWGEKGIIYVAAVLTLVILIFAEITPKVYAKYFNERVSFIAAPILSVIIIIFNPVVVLVTYISNKILFLIGIDVSKIKKSVMTEEEMQTYINVGWAEGAITDEERKIMSRVFTLNDKTAGDIMVPEEKMTVLSIDDTIDKAVKIVLKTGFSRFPVTRADGKEIAGSIHAKDLFKVLDKKTPGALANIVRPPYYISSDKKIDDQLLSFKTKRLHQAIVTDNKGKIVGLVTLEDVLEELVGSIKDEHDK